ncbi:hypothetical protein D3C71_1818130 [compost metagenome]
MFIHRHPFFQGNLLAFAIKLPGFARQVFDRGRQGLSATLLIIINVRQALGGEKSGRCTLGQRTRQARDQQQ